MDDRIPVTQDLLMKWYDFILSGIEDYEIEIYIIGYYIEDFQILENLAKIFLKMKSQRKWKILRPDHRCDHW